MLRNRRFRLYLFAGSSRHLRTNTLEPPAGFEPATSSLQVMHSDRAELQGQAVAEKNRSKRRGRDSNPDFRPKSACAVTLALVCMRKYLVYSHLQPSSYEESNLVLVITSDACHRLHLRSVNAARKICSGTLIFIHLKEVARTSAPQRRAGNRDRTGVICLEGRGSTIELHPREHVREKAAKETARSTP